MPTNQEIAAAHEAIRLADFQTFDASQQAGPLWDLMVAYRTLYEAEHPADGDEPATEEWFESTYGTRHYDLGEDFMLVATRRGAVALHAEGRGRCDSIYQLAVPTRGQVRHLLAAFKGVE